MAEPEKKRDPNQPLSKDGPKKASFGVRLLKMLVLGVFLLVVGTMTAYSREIGTWPWSWQQNDWQGYLFFVKLKAQDVQDRVEAIDWDHVKTTVTGKTKQLWSDAPGVVEKIERKLGVKKDAPAQPGAPPQTPPGELGPEHKLALEAMREGITHYRKSPDDPAEVGAAKKKFEEASSHFEKALKETNDDKTKADIAQELSDCNKYLEDCRAREKP